MFDFFKNFADKSACQSIGVCSIHPSVVIAGEILINEIREIAFYLVKLKEFGITNHNATAICIEYLSIFLINTNFDKKGYLKILNELRNIKNEVKEKYLEYCNNMQFPCEVINCEFEFNDKMTTNQIIKNYEEINFNKTKNFDKKKIKLFELIKLFVKLTAVNTVRIKKFEPNYDKYDFEILRFFALTNGYSIRNEKIIRRILEFSDIALNIKKKLLQQCEEKFGKKENSNINISAVKGHCILVSGCDFFELQSLIITLEQQNAQNINIYTNGPLFLAHFYPYFKNNKYIKGHLGSDSAEYDFSTFPGAILITKNFIQKIDNLYRGIVYSNKIISFEKFLNIENNNFQPLIQSAYETEGFLENQSEKILNVDYNYEQIDKTISEFKDDKIIIILGKIKKNIFYDNTKVISLNCPCEMDILLDIINKLQEKKIKITIFFSQFTLENINTVFMFLNKNINIYLSEYFNALISPYVVESLKEDFNIKTINLM